MADKSLQSFYNDSEMRENVYNYLIDFLEKRAIEKVFGRKDVSAIAEAKDIITDSFENLEILFDSKVNKKEQTNQTR